MIEIEQVTLGITQLIRISKGSLVHKHVVGNLILNLALIIMGGPIVVAADLSVADLSVADLSVADLSVVLIVVVVVKD